MGNRIMEKDLAGILEILDGVHWYGLPLRVRSRIDETEFESLYALKFQCEGILRGELVSTDRDVLKSMLDLADATVLYLEKIVQDMYLDGDNFVIELSGYLNDDIREGTINTTAELREELELSFEDGEIVYVYGVATLEADVTRLDSMVREIRGNVR